MGEVAQLRVPERTCFECVHLLQPGSWCEEFGERILSEKAAASDCEVYERTDVRGPENMRWRCD